MIDATIRESRQRLAEAALQQAAILAADERPWVTFINIKFAGDMTFEGNGAKLGLTFNLANTGHVPAIKAEISFNPFVVKEGFGE